MPEYTYHKADPNKYKRMAAKFDRDLDKAVCEIYLRRLNLYNRDEFEQWRTELEKQFEESESNWFQKIISYLYYKLMLPKIEELADPKKLFFVLSKLDKTIKYLPPGYWVAVIRGLDWVADLVYKNME